MEISTMTVYPQKDDHDWARRLFSHWATTPEQKTACDSVAGAYAANGAVDARAYDVFSGARIKWQKNSTTTYFVGESRFASLEEARAAAGPGGIRYETEWAQ